MTKYSGKDCYIAWIHAGGTAVLSDDFRDISEKPSVKLSDASAGDDEDETFVATIKGGLISYSGLLSAGGTVVINSLVEGAVGTIIIGPEGTATGKPKRTYPAISMGPVQRHPYSDIAEVTCDFTKNGALVKSTYPV
jgi:hypothetical protein